MGLNLEDLRAPLEEVKFLSGTKIVPVPFGPPEYALWRAIEKEIPKDAPDRQKIGNMAMQIIRACYPGVTDDDLLDCTSDMLMALTAYPGGKIDMVRAALKNAAAVEVQPQATPPATTSPSTPTTSGNTSASKSRKRSAKTSGTSTTASPTEGPSSSGTPTTDSTSLAESTPYSVKWTPSTPPASPPTP